MILPIAFLSLFSQGTSMAWWILLALGVAGMVFVYFKFDDRREERRKRALRAAAECREIGDDLVAKLLEDYAVGDKTGMAKTIHDTVSNLLDRDGDGPVAMRAKLVRKILPKIALDPTFGPGVRKVVKEVYDAKPKETPKQEQANARSKATEL